MAQLHTITLIDDLSGGEAVETVSFSLDGAAYDIDLNASNAAEMREIVGRYVAAGRPAGTVVDADPSALQPTEEPAPAKPRAPRKPRAKAKAKPAKKTARRARAAAEAPADAPVENAEAPAAAAPKAKRARSGGRKKKAPAGPSQADIRAWATEQGIDVPPRGRISNAVREQYLAAQAG